MNWEDYIEDSSLIQVLRSNSMPEPTDIQKASLLHTCKYRQDVIISSKTGSGKTLCFAIPMVLHIEKNQGLQGLIISPTRELCLQISTHLKAVNHKDLNLLTLIGGVSHEKQERLVKRNPEIVIATPGRLWEYIKDRQNDYLRTIHSVKFLAIDEADRMIQMGHFKELKLLINYIENPSIVPKEIAEQSIKGNVIDLNFGYEETEENHEVVEKKNKRQTFVISATMTIEKSARKAFSGKLGRFKDRGEDIMEKLNQTINFRLKPKLIDLTLGAKMPEGLKEYVIMCRDEEKCGLLHYVLKENTGTKGIIFTNTIAASRKLVTFLKYLDYKVSKLDGKMPQRDRLSKLEK
jgi:ATP-dependent RNA helicase DDX24/MAK5